MPGQADQPGPLVHKSLGLARGRQDRASTLHQRDAIRALLPRIGTPGAKTLGFPPVPHRPGRDGREGRIVGDTPSQCCLTPVRTWDGLLPGQATGDGPEVHPLLLGNNTSALHGGVRRPVEGFALNARAMCTQCDRCRQRLRSVVDSFVRDEHAPGERSEHLAPALPSVLSPGVPALWFLHWSHGLDRWVWDHALRFPSSSQLPLPLWPGHTRNRLVRRCT